jgi:murein DD-endopeptidase MepM/ murein hydrolase activator NlpD
MATVVNNFDYPVIAVDARDWDVSWQHHIERGSAGGADLAYPYGTPIKAPMAGVFTYTEGKGSGGNIGRIAASDNTVVELMHCSARLVPNGSTVQIGDDVVKSGASGFGKARYYAPHLHTHAVVNGVRRKLSSLFSKSTTTPAGESGAVITNPEEDDMTQAQFDSITRQNQAIMQRLIDEDKQNTDRWVDDAKKRKVFEDKVLAFLEPLQDDEAMGNSQTRRVATMRLYRHGTTLYGVNLINGRWHKFENMAEVQKFVDLGLMGDGPRQWLQISDADLAIIHSQTDTK